MTRVLETRNGLNVPRQNERWSGDVWGSTAFALFMATCNNQSVPRSNESSESGETVSDSASGFSYLFGIPGGATEVHSPQNTPEPEVQAGGLASVSERTSLGDFCRQHALRRPAHEGAATTLLCSCAVRSGDSDAIVLNCALNSDWTKRDDCCTFQGWSQGGVLWGKLLAVRMLRPSRDWRPA